MRTRFGRRGTFAALGLACLLYPLTAAHTPINDAHFAELLLKCFYPAARMVRFREFGTWPGAENEFADDSWLLGIHFTRSGEYAAREYYVEIAFLRRMGKRFTERRAVLVQEPDGDDPDPACRLHKWS